MSSTMGRHRVVSYFKSRMMANSFTRILDLNPKEVFMLKHFALILLVVIGTVLFAVLPALANIVLWPAWVRSYNGPGNRVDEARAMAIDGSGNLVVVTGGSFGVPPTNYDCTTIMYDPTGAQLWTQRYNGPASGADYGWAVTMDVPSNVYVAGYTWNGVNYDYLVIAYNPGGGLWWFATYDGPGSKDDFARDIFVDQAGFVYVTGYSQGGANYDYATIKYAPGGAVVWVSRYAGLGGNDYADALTVDSAGMVYVTGYSAQFPTPPYNLDYATVVYDPAGAQVWVGRYNGPFNGDDKAHDIEIDLNAGWFYVTGEAYFSAPASPDYVTIKYQQGGDQLWVINYDGPAMSTDVARDLELDRAGNIYLTGRSVGPGTADDYASIKYNPAGVTLWVQRYNNPMPNQDDWGQALAIDDNSSEVYVTGWSNQLPGGNSDYVTLKYDLNSGLQISSNRHNGVGNGNDYVFDIVADNTGNFYVIGISTGAGTSEDYCTIKYIQCLCGDANLDGIIDIGDLVHVINHVFYAGPLPLCDTDVNHDGVVDIGDIVFLTNYVFYNGPEPNCM